MSCRCKKVTGWEMTAGQSQNGSFPSLAWACPLAPQQLQTSDQSEKFPSQNGHRLHLYYRENMDITAGACQDTEAGLQSWT